MSGVWHKTLVYLGLVEEPEEHDDLPEQFEHADAPDLARERPAAVPTASRRPEPATAGGDAGNVRRLPIPEPGPAHVRAMDADVRVAVLPVAVFEDVERIGQRYRSGVPVVFDMRETDSAVARRILDFVSGLTYALRGRLVPAGRRCFLLVPDGVELPAEERRRLEQMGYRVAAGARA